MSEYPEYEVWECGDECGPDKHLEDCMTREDAREAVKDWRENGYACFVKFKDTGEISNL